MRYRLLRCLFICSSPLYIIITPYYNFERSCVQLVRKFALAVVVIIFSSAIKSYVDNSNGIKFFIKMTYRLIDHVTSAQKLADFCNDCKRLGGVRGLLAIQMAVMEHASIMKYIVIFHHIEASIPYKTQGIWKVPLKQLLRALLIPKLIYKSVQQTSPIGFLKPEIYLKTQQKSHNNNCDSYYIPFQQ